MNKLKPSDARRILDLSEQVAKDEVFMVIIKRDPGKNGLYIKDLYTARQVAEQGGDEVSAS